MDSNKFKPFICVTSIAQPTMPLKELAILSQQYDFEVIVAGDSKSPSDFYLDGVSFLSVEDQLNSEFTYAKKAPLRNYCRKNIAYLEAIKRGANFILETDDDNVPYHNFFTPHEKIGSVKTSESDLKWINVYKYFSSDLIWPRGFNLAHVRSPIPDFDTLPINQLHCPVQNGLVDEDPDVDAIFRLLLDLPFTFEEKDRRVALAKGTWCSFNTQNTSFYEEAFPLMYQPATPLFREADILRSYVIQRILWENDWNISFHSPTVRQIRNPHNYIEDLKQEVRLYAFAGELCKRLEDLSIKRGALYFKENMIKCYELYMEYGFCTSLEIELIDVWFEDLRKLK